MQETLGVTLNSRVSDLGNMLNSWVSDLGNTLNSRVSDLGNTLNSWVSDLEMKINVTAINWTAVCCICTIVSKPYIMDDQSPIDDHC